MGVRICMHVYIYNYIYFYITYLVIKLLITEYVYRNKYILINNHTHMQRLTGALLYNYDNKPIKAGFSGTSE